MSNVRRVYAVSYTHLDVYKRQWPLHSPNVEKVEIVRKGKVRRAKLYYLRDRIGKAAKVKDCLLYTSRCV